MRFELAVEADPGLVLKVGGDPPIKAEAGVINVSGAPTYEGAYTVRPEVVEQRLKTANKIMAQDMTVQRIPRYEVGNDAGGTTFSIGGNIGD